MKLAHLTPPGLVLGLTLWFLPGTGANAFVLSGDSLGLRQRDFRVFDNFSDPSASDNTAPHPDFPGATGAALAIWKAAAEWGSRPHGLGLGDPSQAEVGSGGANFDAFYQGLASDVGGPDDNVFSELSGFGGGVLGFAEIPTTDGWRIRFYSNPTVWDDGPGAPIPGGTDLQGIACHEYGHALGLDHTNDFAATMSVFTSDAGVNLRSIEDDDRAGLQALYGVAAPTKPTITTYALTGGVVRLIGSHFDPFENEVWLTPAGPGGDGTPIKVSGLTSSAGGTQLDFALPSQAGRGDVLVKIGTSPSPATLSNAFPFDPAGVPCVIPEPYGTAKLTSIGTLPTIEFTGLPSVQVNDFQIGTFSGLNSGMGLLFSGPAPAAQPFFGGTLLVSGPWRREAMFQFNFLSAQVDVPLEVADIGQTRYYQLWFRDSGDPQGIGLSNALEVTVCP